MDTDPPETTEMAILPLPRQGCRQLYIHLIQRCVIGQLALPCGWIRVLGKPCNSEDTASGDPGAISCQKVVW